MTTMMYPRINLNGTSAETLLDEIREAHTASTAFLSALEKMTVHGRDYQTHEHGNHALNIAVAEHRDRLEKVRSVRKDLENLYIEITKQERLR